MAVESHAVTPEAHAAAKSGEAPYPGQTEPSKTAAAEAEPEAQPEAEATSTDSQPESQDASAEAQADDAAETAQEAAEAAGLDYEGLYNEFAETGALSQESVAAIKEAMPGVTDEMLAVHLAGVAALAQQAVQAGHNLVGGTENYNAMSAWAAENLPAGEIAAYNAALQRSSEDAKFAIEGLYARFQSASGRNNAEPDYSHTARQAPGDPPIRSRQDLMKLIRDPRYAKDEAFRNRVDAQVEIAIRDPNYSTF